MSREASREQRVVGRYMLCDEIAAGGMATVHIGRLLGPVGFARTVAIKRLHAHFAKDPEFVAMFLDEARIAGRIRHPNVASTLDVVVLKGEMLVVMEYVHGEALSRLVRACRGQTGRGVPPSIALTVIAGALNGLNAAHEARDDHGAPLEIVHRDVSPQNILVGQDGIARVVDFGVAKATGRMQSTREGALKGKLAYMSPEQISSDHVDRRTDVYAAAVVLWEMLAGQRLFAAENEARLLHTVLSAPVAPPSRFAPGLPPAIDSLVLKGLARDPAQRFATAAEMAEAAQQLGFATPGQISGWVKELGGAALDERAARVVEIESTSSMSPLRSPSHADDNEATVVREFPQPPPAAPMGDARAPMQSVPYHAPPFVPSAPIAPAPLPAATPIPPPTFGGSAPWLPPAAPIAPAPIPLSPAPPYPPAQPVAAMPIAPAPLPPALTEAPGSQVSSVNVAAALQPRSRAPLVAAALAPVVVAVLAGGAFLVLRSARDPEARPAESAAATAPDVPTPSPAAPAPTTTASAEAPPDPPASASAPPAAEPRATASPAATAKPAKKPNCNPPYRIDKRGVRVPKMECL